MGSWVDKGLWAKESALSTVSLQTWSATGASNQTDNVCLSAAAVGRNVSFPFSVFALLQVN